MTKKALLLFCLMITIMLSGTSAMAFTNFLKDVNNACGYDVFAGAECLGCHLPDDNKAPTYEKDLYLAEGACAFCTEVTSCNSAPPTEAELLADAQGVTKTYFETLFSEFTTALQDAGGTTSPTVFADVFPKCPEMAPVIASQFSRDTGYLVRRVTTRTRNSRNMPDDWELEQLLNFEKMAAAGKPRTQFDITKPDSSILPTREFEAYAVVTEGKGKDTEIYFRYMRSITMPPLTKTDPDGNTVPFLPCLKCHGTTGQLGVGVAEAVEAFYPFDKAMGYAAGDIRGAWTIKIPLIEMPSR